MSNPITALARTQSSASSAIQKRAAFADRVLALTNWILPLAVIGLMFYYTTQSQAFLTPQNLFAIAAQNAPAFIVAVVAAMLLMAGYVDLSVGSALAVVGVSAGLAMNTWGLIPGILVGIGAGLLFGVVNGVLIGFLNFSPIVVTLGGLAAGRSIALLLDTGQTFSFPEAFSAFGHASIFGVPLLVIVVLIVCAAAVAVMGLLPIGRKIIAIGVNARAAFLVGIRVKTVTFGLYAAVGLAVGIAGLLQIARLDSAPSGTLGVGFEVVVLTAVLLGGVPFQGGRGSIWRVIIGVWLIAVLKNGLTLLNVGTELSGLITGGVLILVAGLEALRVYYATKR